MQSMPHHYLVQSSASSSSFLTTSSQGLPDLSVAPPAEFDGPGDQWSPETLMMSAVASCFILSFKAVSTFSKFEWLSIDCHSEGILDRVDKSTRFVQVTNRVKLVISEGSSKDKALTLLEKAEAICLVSNSLNAELKLECEVIVK